MNICVVGTGYVGLVTSAVLADLGNEVYGADTDEPKIDGLKQGRMPIYEPGLEELVTRNMGDGRLTFTTDLAAGVRRSEIIFVAVGTPANGDGSSDLSAVGEVAREIGVNMDGYKLVVNKSTVPVGTGDLVRRTIAQHQPVPVPFDVVSNPEFLREGSAIEDALRPDRIVIGAPSQTIAARLLELYAPLERPIVLTDVASAELIKYASNAFLATKISFINAIANLCERTGADVTQVAKGMGLDPRVGMSFLQAGIGFGGACFPKDTASLVQTAEGLGADFELLKTVLKVNEDRVPRLTDQIRRVLAPLDGKVIGVLGLAFKPNTDDLRHAKSVELIRALHEAGASVRAYDPVATENARALLPASVQYCASPYEAAEAADALVLVTEWNEFRSLNFERLRAAMRRPVIFDGRKLYDPAQMQRLGFEYHSIGRHPVLR